MSRVDDNGVMIAGMDRLIELSEEIAGLLATRLPATAPKAPAATAPAEALESDAVKAAMLTLCDAIAAAVSPSLIEAQAELLASGHVTRADFDREVARREEAEAEAAALKAAPAMTPEQHAAVAFTEAHAAWVNNMSDANARVQRQKFDAYLAASGRGKS